MADSRTVAAVGSIAFFVLAPGVVAGLIPWWLTGWRMREPMPFWAPLRVLGAALIVAGTVVLVYAFVLFVTAGGCTPAPVAPAEGVVGGGPFRAGPHPPFPARIPAFVRR